MTTRGAPSRSLRHLRIDFISDIVCPWCVIGLRALEHALSACGDDLTAAVHLHPFELNPDMPPEGEAVAAHIARKYGRTPTDMSGVRAEIAARSAALGFTMNSDPDSRIVNTFDAHRLLHWAGLPGAGSQGAGSQGAGSQGAAIALKHRLFAAHFTDQRNVNDHDVLVDAAVATGLDAAEARAILTSGTFAREVRAEQEYWRREGISAVPTMIIDGDYVIQGAQPAETIERALRRIVATTAT